MSDPVVLQPLEDSARRSPRGQSLVEFALVLPMLIVLLLGVADFGRVFSSGITVEAAARNGAEVAAQEYLRNPPGPLADPAPLPGDAAYYANLHDIAAATACKELRHLPNAGYDDMTETCSEVVVLVCVHDSADPSCADSPTGVAAPASMPNCDGMAPLPEPVQEAETAEMRYVEVRVCYRFTTIFNLTDLQLPLGFGLNIGEIHLERSRTFTVADW